MSASKLTSGFLYTYSLGAWRLIVLMSIFYGLAPCMEELYFHKDKVKSHIHFKTWFSCHLLQEAFAAPPQDYLLCIPSLHYHVELDHCLCKSISPSIWQFFKAKTQVLCTFITQTLTNMGYMLNKCWLNLSVPWTESQAYLCSWFWEIYANLTPNLICQACI